MKKVLITFGLMLFLTNIAYSNETKCAKEIQEGTAKKTENFKENVKNLTNKAKNKIKKKE